MNYYELYFSICIFKDVQLVKFFVRREFSINQRHNGILLYVQHQRHQQLVNHQEQRREFSINQLDKA